MIVFPYASTSSALDIYYQTTSATTTQAIYPIWVRQQWAQSQTITASIWSTWSNSYLDLERQQFEYEQRHPRQPAYGELARDMTPPVDPEYVKKRAEEKRLALMAEERADELLMSLLTPSQLMQYRAAKCFEVCTKAGRRYRLTRAISGSIKLIGPDGRATATYCAHLGGSIPIPVPDHLIAQKFMLEHHEEEFLRVANRT
jgi:hypothetical protein